MQNVTKNDNRIVIGVSSCLLGERVRFDGGHKRDSYLCDLLANYVDFLPICPEVAIGMGTPRPPVRLIGNAQSPSMVDIKNPNKDYTAAMLNFSQNIMKQLQNISGYILKSKSPSCGLKRVKIYQDQGQAPRMGQGIYAKTLTEYYPWLPIEEEGRLNDPHLRENFIERLFVYKEWQDLVKTGLTNSSLLDFHTRHKLTLMAHHPIRCRMLGKKVSRINEENLSVFAIAYLTDLMETLGYIATPKKHTNVLQHCLGYFKKQLDKKDKQELLEAIESYRRGLLPLIVPITLLKHHLNHHQQPYLEKQSYLAPYPQELMLRNHI
ncbi:YbgA family protein [Legionella brunensis]|uniref:DUF1722 domain-containing protein n=1 Tax=Legionella brunensis TaxID=29422 RepID=A0A0W0SNW6_9GAMM|nr:DUF523 and DUF1722 domain-containing protein [Legionella brunensis]KTC85056.1 hypothetical protein Lbru_1271 [Legionella brunensis]